MTQLFVAVSNDGQMSGQEMLRELKEHCVCPVMTFVENGKTVVPLFESIPSAQRFAKRNTHRDYAIGTMAVNQKDLDQFDGNGWVTEVMDFPKRKEIVVEVVQLQRGVETHSVGHRRSIK